MMVSVTSEGCSSTSLEHVVQDLEHVPPRVGEGAGVLLDQVEVLLAHLPDRRVAPGEERRVGELPLGRHDSVHPSLRHAPLHVRKVL